MVAGRKKLHVTGLLMATVAVMVSQARTTVPTVLTSALSMLAAVPVGLLPGLNLWTVRGFSLFAGLLDRGSRGPAVARRGSARAVRMKLMTCIFAWILRSGGTSGFGCC